MFGGACAGFWWIFPIIMIVMIVACFFMMRSCCPWSGRRHQGVKARLSSDDSAVEILKKRYALGELDRKEYEEMRDRIVRDEK